MVRKSNNRSITATERPRLRRRDVRRDGILHAAARMFRERGFTETGMRDIATAAELSPANLYHYFKGKDEILFYCQDRALDRMLDAVAAARRTTDPPAARLASILETHVRTMLNEVEGATAHLQVDALAAPLRARIVRKRDRYEHAIRRMLTEGARSGAFVVGDVALTARAMLGALNWSVTWYRPEGAQPPDVIAREMARFLVRGVTAGR
jgi:AcrR family transcriptional regulator